MNDAAAILVGSLAGLHPDEAEREFLRQEAPAGLTLFGRNIDQHDHQALAATLELCQSLQPAHSPPFLIAIDQEGGRVARLRQPTPPAPGAGAYSFPNQGPALYLAEGKTDIAAQKQIFTYAQELGLALRTLGIHVNFAPVLDILTEEENTAIGDRAFARDAAGVSLRAGAFLKGLLAAGILPCLKHFPGQGAARHDTHLGSAVIQASLAELSSREFVPFKAWLNLSPLVMIAHCIYPALDNKEASLSAVVMQQLLRQKLGYQGLIVTDDMTMGAITQQQRPWTDLILEAVANGADMVLVCQGLENWHMALTALQKEAKNSSTFRERLHEAANRVRALRTRLPSKLPIAQ